MFRPCAVIPVYDHERAIGRVVENVAALQLPCTLVDDGSGADCQRELRRIACRVPGVMLLRLPVRAGRRVP